MMAMFLKAKDFEALVRDMGAKKEYYMAGFPAIGGQVTHRAVVDGVEYFKMSPLCNPELAGKFVTICDE